MLFSALAFLLGHCLVHCMTVLPDLWSWGWLLGAIIVALIAGMCFARRAQSLRLTRYLAVGLALSAGAGWAWSHAAWQMADRLPSSETQIDVQITGFIASTLTVNEAGVRFLFKLRDEPRDLPEFVELTWYDTDQRPAPGEQWQLHVRLRPPHGFANPGGADFEAQLLRNGIGATGYVRGGISDQSSNRRLAIPTWRYPVLRLRSYIASKLAVALSDAPDLNAMLGIVQGLAVGETGQIGSDQWRVFANTGTTHLIAISGSHIGMVAFLMSWLSGAVARRISLQSRGIAVVDVQSVCGMLAAIVYAALAGFSVPTQRTLAMLTVYFGTRLLRREVQVTQGLAIALIGVLLIDPFAPLAPGFWLSFGAVAAIFLASSGRVIRPSWHKQYLSLQVAVGIGLLPFLIGAFGSVSLLSPLVNLLAIPWFTFVIVPIVLMGSFCLMTNDWLGGIVVHVAAQLLQWSWSLLSQLSALPFAMGHFPQWPVWVAIMLLIGCIVTIAPGMVPTRLAGAMLCVPALTWRPDPLQLGSFELAVLDVGQGLSTVIRTRNHTLVYDAGPSFRSGRDTGQLVVLPYLHARGVRSIDMLMISHGDNDHVGGAASIATGMPTQRIVVGPSVDAAAIAMLPAERCTTGLNWLWDEVTFTVLHPNPDDEDKPRRARQTNDTSCVLSVVSKYGSALLTGDIEKQTEAQLLNAHSLAHADIVVVPHHGSRTSSTASFATATAPRYAVVSSGFGNRWGFPKREVLENWHAVNAATIVTAQSGAVEITIDVQGISVPRAYRLEHRAYWRD